MLIPNKHSGYTAGIRLYPGKGGGSSAPPPDPRLVEGQLKSMGVQDDLIKQIMANNTDLAPLQKEQLQFGLDSARTANDQSQQDRNWMLTRRDSLSKVQDKIVGDASNFSEDARAADLAGQARGDVAQGFTDAEGQAARATARMGLNPNSGAGMDMQRQVETAKALGLASATNGARNAAHAEGLALTDRANNTLAGYPAMSAAATGAGLASGTAGVGLANASLAGLNSGATAAGGLAGQMGSNATGMFNAQANYKNAQDQIEQSGTNAIWGALGTAGGMALGNPNIIKSDRGLKDHIKPMSGRKALAGLVDAKPAQWRYKRGSHADDGGRPHIGAMAQDMHKGLGDAVAPGGKVLSLGDVSGVHHAAIVELARRMDKAEKNGGLADGKRRHA